MKKKIHVVGAAILRDGKVLVLQRGFEKSLPGLWEFPGGKVEAQENEKQALIREIQEELNMDILIEKYIATNIHTYDFAEIELSVYTARMHTNAEIELTEHIAYKWLLPSELEQIEWAPADIPIVKQLQVVLSSL